MKVLTNIQYHSICHLFEAVMILKVKTRKWGSKHNSTKVIALLPNSNHKDMKNHSYTKAHTY